MPITETAGAGFILKRGDGGVGAGTKASRTIGTSNQQIILRARVAGTAGNSKTCSIVVSGNNTPFNLSVSASNITVTSATDGSGVATTTVNELLYQLMQNSTFVDNWEATRGAGNGTGVVVAAGSAALTGGTEGAEVFTEILGLHNNSGPNRTMEILTARHHGITGTVKKPSFKDEGQITFDLFYDSTDTQHLGLSTDFENKSRRNFRAFLTDTGLEELQFAAYVTNFAYQPPVEDWNRVSVTIEITGDVTRV